MQAKTFLRRQVNRSVASQLSFRIEHEVVVVERAVNDVCRRCMKPFGSDDPWPVITKTCAPMDTWIGRTAWALRAQVPRYVVALYHLRCVPPQVFHAAAGSRPAPGRSRVAPTDARVSPPRAARPGVSGSRHVSGPDEGGRP